MLSMAAGRSTMAEKWWQRYLKLASAVWRMNMRRRSACSTHAAISH